MRQMVKIVLVTLIAGFSAIHGEEGTVVSGNCVNGYGVMEYEGGARYEGSWRSGKWHGKGTLYTAERAVISGTFQNGQLNGKGILLMPNGYRYLGSFVNTMIHGMGTLYESDGSVYQEGIWIENEYFGKPLAGNCLNGKGTLALADDGGTYIGQFKDGRFEGQGTLNVPDSVRCTGQWKRGELDGKGEVEYANGARYIGGFKAGLYHGSGIWYAPNGEIYEGIFTDGKMQGKGEVTLPDTFRYIGDISDTKMTGIGTMHYQDGSVHTGSFVDGVPHGKGTRTFYDGATIEADWINGRVPADEGTSVWTNNLYSPIADVRFSPDGSYVSCMLESAEIYYVLDADDGRWKRRIRAEELEPYPSQIVIDPDEKLVAVSRFDGICFWDIKTGSRESHIPLKQSLITEIAFSPDGRYLAGRGDGVHLWRREAPAWRLEKTIGAAEDLIWQFAFLAKGTMITTISMKNEWCLWDVTSGKKIHAEALQDGALGAMAVNTKGTLLAYGGAAKTLTIRDIASKAVVARCEGHCGTITAIAFNPDGRRVASAGIDGIIRIWDISSATVTKTIAAHSGAVQAISYSPDGDMLVSGGIDGRVIMWEVD